MLSVPSRSIRFSNTLFFLSLLFGFSFIFMILSSNQFDFYLFLFLNFLVLSSSVIILSIELSTTRGIKIFHPLSIFFLFNIFLGLILPNLRYLYSDPFDFLPAEYQMVNIDLFWHLNFSMFLHCLGFLAFYLGYKFIFSNKLSNSFDAFLKKWSYLEGDNLLDSKFLLSLLLFFYFLGLVIKSSLGMFSYGDELSNDISSYTAYIKLLDTLSYLFFLCVGFNFHRGIYFFNKLTIFSLLIICTLVNFSTGSKFAVILPITCFGIGYLFSSKRLIFNLSFYAFSSCIIGTLFLAYLIVEPYRIIRANDIDLDLKEAFVEVANYYSNDEFEGPSIEESLNFYKIPNAILSRFDMFGASSNTVAFVRERGFPDYQGSYDAPDFQLGILMAPIYGLVPRALWKDKPSESIGIWVQTNILESPIFSAAYVGNIGYAYISGGIIGILLIYALFGLIARFFSDIFYGSKQIRRNFIFLVLFIPFLRMESELGPILQGFIRNVPVFIVSLSILFFINDKLSSHVK